MPTKLETLELRMDKAKAYYYTKEIQETDDAAIHYKAYMKYIAARTAYKLEYNERFNK
tara:strand:+ start:300 stop:473 length:174 start_codon:yes stop_codon:yes gene_type:complete